MIRAAVHTGEYSDSSAEEYLANVLIRRRDKVIRLYLNAVNPIVNPRLGEDGRLIVDNAAVAADVASGAATYRASWFRFDNATGETHPLSETQSTTTTVEAPRGLPTASGSFVGADVSVESEGHPTWRRPVRVFFRRGDSGWTLVGLERMPESAATSTRVAADHL
jgi:hypothetical protein